MGRDRLAASARRTLVGNDLTPEAAELLPCGYAPVLHGVLDALAAQLDPASREALLREVGRKLAAGRPVTHGGVRERLAAGADVLNDLGGLAEAREVDAVPSRSAKRHYHCSQQIRKRPSALEGL